MVEKYFAAHAITNHSTLQKHILGEKQGTAVVKWDRSYQRRFELLVWNWEGDKLGASLPFQKVWPWFQSLCRSVKTSRYPFDSDYLMSISNLCEIIISMSSGKYHTCDFSSWFAKSLFVVFEITLQVIFIIIYGRSSWPVWHVNLLISVSSLICNYI